MITSDEVRSKYLKFFEVRGHKVISPAPLVLENDPTTLFISSGMQPLVPYLMGEKHPEGKRLVDSQPSIRAQGKNDDILEVGDSRHLTYFEMLGNWSLGDYFKNEQLAWIWEFYTRELRIPKEKLHVTLFEGDGKVEKDEESYKIWKSLGISDDRIFYYDVKKNWWSRSGPPDEMPEGEIGGPTSEVFYEFTSIPHDKKFGEKCHPNCDCGRFLEVGNNVFMVYKKANNKLKELPNKNVDFGGGLERIIAAANDDPDVFRTDLFWPTIEKIEKQFGTNYEDNIKPMQIIADHLRASLALIDSGVIPSNKQQGYVLRRLIRRMVVKLREVTKDITSDDVREITKNKEILDEVRRFNTSLDNGLREVQKIKKIDGKIAFDLYQSYGFPLELIIELFEKKGQKVDLEEFKKEFEKHKNLSRTASAGTFKGGLADHSIETTKLHTVTHLLHASLRKVLGDHVSQKGSNITAERLRFDFSHPQKLTEEEIKKVEDLINEQIEKKLPVSFSEMTFEEAKEKGALAFFGEKYGEKVKVYKIGDFSMEVCGGPHVENLKVLGRVRISKQDKLGSNLIRIYAVLAQNGS